MRRKIIFTIHKMLRETVEPTTRTPQLRDAVLPLHYECLKVRNERTLITEEEVVTLRDAWEHPRDLLFAGVVLLESYLQMVGKETPSGFSVVKI